METRQTRTLTNKAMASYEEKVEHFKVKFRDGVEKLNRHIHERSDLSINNSIASLNQCRDQCKMLFQSVQEVYGECMLYLEGMKTNESQKEIGQMDDMFVSLENRVTNYLEQVKKARLEKLEVMSEASVSSQSIIRKQAEANAAKVRLEFAEEELKLQREKSIAARRQADIDSELKLLKHKQEAAILVAEARELADIARSQALSQASVSDVKEDPMSRVQDFVDKIEPSCTPKAVRSPESDSIQNNFAQFLLRKDLIISRLTHFNDSCEHFQAWKASFRSVSDEMMLSGAEEVDLLLKYLGPSSSKHAISLRTAYLHDPDEACAQIWKRLEERYGTPESVLCSLTNRLKSFPSLANKDKAKLYELSDILQEIEGLMNNPKYSRTLSYFDSSVGVNPIVGKLPHQLRQKWITHAASYKSNHDTPFPPFSYFAEFVRKFSVILNDPSLSFDDQLSTQPMKRQERGSTNPTSSYQKNHLSSAKTGVQDHSSSKQRSGMCLIHSGAPHSLGDCKVFKSKSENDKKSFLREHRLCYRCYSSDHQVRDCKSPVKKFSQNGGEQVRGEGSQMNTKQQKHDVKQSVDNKCTRLCGDESSLKSCAKIVLVNIYSKDEPDNVIQCYAMVDDQSNRCLARSELFHLLEASGKSVEYTMSSCSGTSVKYGRELNGLVIECIDKPDRYDLPVVLECDDIPNNRNEIPTPSVAANHSHLSDIAQCIPKINENAQILLLLGRDIPDVHHVLEQRLGPRGSPYAQRLPLGWVVVGEVCLGSSHLVPNVSVNKIFVGGDGRATLLPPCPSRIHVSDTRDLDETLVACNGTYTIDNGRYTLFRQCDKVPDLDPMFAYDFVFACDVHDDKSSLSVDDKDFLAIMSDEFVLGTDDKWSAPLPFKKPRIVLPNNRAQALQRAKSLQANLEKHPTKKEHFVEFMGKLFEHGHAELAPELPDGTECWYLPIFGVYHPKKPDKIRVVFDSSAKYEGVSLNSVLLQGPDLTNSLLGILLRFRRELVAVSVDVEQMFYCFSVGEKDRDYLRFLWHEDNDTSKPLVEYRMCKHVFGNSPSPAIANYGLKKAAEKADDDVTHFVQKDFYVDDGLTSRPTVTQAVDLIKNTQTVLADTGIHLHKICSNDSDVLKAFPKKDLAVGLTSVDFELENLPTQRSLGLGWDLDHDCFFFSNQADDKPVTKRGILSTINSVFDPIGFLSPVIINGRLILRAVVSDGVGWDEPLTAELEGKWRQWVKDLSDLDCIRIPRTLFRISLSDMRDFELHIFSDASEKAISAVGYIVGCSPEGIKLSSFLIGKAKVAPSSGHTIPRLELCAAVLATELYSLSVENMCVHFAQVCFYTDSKVVLGYINNQSKRFFTYVSNRIQKIRRVSTPKQWRHVASEKNPADVGTRGSSPLQLRDSLWFRGPDFLREQKEQFPEFYPLVDSQSDSEVRTTNIVAMATGVSKVSFLGTSRFERFSSWSRLVLALGVLVHIASSFKKDSHCKSWHLCPEAHSQECKSQATRAILREVQFESFKETIEELHTQSPLSKGRALFALDPFLDEFGILRVGGRLRHSSLPIEEKHPIILPSKHHITKLLLRHFHESVHHQGRLLTEGAIRQGGYWIIGGKRAVSSLIFNCVICKRLRGKFETQKMSDLPLDRTEQAPAFSFVGVDVFGPWQVVTRKTRSSQASAKRWAILFTCLLIRAVHIEVVEEMTSSAFINALRRFIAIRGKVKVFRSDRGSNFVGAMDHIGVDAVNVEDGRVGGFLESQSSTWIFNAPHSSHMGGVWERMIGVSRRILESMLLNTHNLTHDVLITLMAEVSAIINARPIVAVSSDPDSPEVLCPSALLNMKLEQDQQPVNDMSIKQLYKDQWKRVQYLAGQFWLRWRKEFLQSLQNRSKWHSDQTPLKVNDIILLKDKEVARNYWPLGRVSKLFPSTDGKIRKLEVCVIKDGKQTFFVRPVVDTVLLVRY